MKERGKMRGNKCLNSRSHFENKYENLLKYKRSQITVFVILAIAIVAVLLVLFLPSIREATQPSTPEADVSSCLIESVQEGLEIARLRGGSINPELYYNYLSEPVGYACYTSQWFEQCVMQKPFIKKSLEAELVRYAKKDVQNCLNALMNDFKSKGYTVNIQGEGTMEVRIVPDKVIIEIDNKLALEKGSLTIVSFDKLKADFDSKIYEQTAIATSIVNYEARYGEVYPEIYSAYYHNEKVEKSKESDGTTIYILTDRNSNEKFQFAVRSVAYPPGYATE